MELEDIETKLKNKLDYNGMLYLVMLAANRKILCTDLLKLCGHKDQQVAFRASWTLEALAGDHISVFLPHVKHFLKLYPTIENLSVQRSFTKILMMLTNRKFMQTQKLSVTIFDECFTATFDWLLHPKTPLAVQCNAMDVVFQLSPFHDWVIEELKVILQQKLISGSPALVSRSKKILKGINSK